MKIQVVIEEHIAQEFEVEAVDLAEAMDIAKEKYDNGEFVVDMFTAPHCRLMMADDGERMSEWEEF